MNYKNFTIIKTAKGNYYISEFGSSEQACNIATAKKWIDSHLNN